MAQPLENHQIPLIALADDLARKAFGATGLAGNEVAYLERFRAAYHHLASTVELNANVRPDEAPEAAAFGTQRGR